MPFAAALLPGLEGAGLGGVDGCCGCGGRAGVGVDVLVRVLHCRRWLSDVVMCDACVFVDMMIGVLHLDVALDVCEVLAGGGWFSW